MINTKIDYVRKDTEKLKIENEKIKEVVKKVSDESNKRFERMEDRMEEFQKDGEKIKMQERKTEELKKRNVDKAHDAKTTNDKESTEKKNWKLNQEEPAMLKKQGWEIYQLFPNKFNTNLTGPNTCHRFPWRNSWSWLTRLLHAWELREINLLTVPGVESTIRNHSIWGTPSTRMRTRPGIRAMLTGMEWRTWEPDMRRRKNVIKQESRIFFTGVYWSVHHWNRSNKVQIC